jgi:acetyl/propionyl-CoA carboxylase alpha subunit
LLVRILAEPEFLAGDTDTAYLDRHLPAELGAPLVDTVLAQRHHAAIAALTLQVVNRATATVWARLPSGWRNNPSAPNSVTLDDGGRVQTVRYLVGRGGAIVADVDGDLVDITLHRAEQHVIDATVDGVRARFHVVIPPDGAWIDVDSPSGASSYIVVPRFLDPADQMAAGSLVAPMPGAVVRVLVEVGATVAKGDALVVLEAMKMEHTVASPADGVVSEVGVQAGQQVDAGTVLVVVDAGDSEGS